MIESIRKFLRSIFFKIIAVLLIASFAFWGIGDFSLNSITKNLVLKIGDLELDGDQVLDEINQLVNQQRLDSLSKKELLTLGISESFLNTIINKKLLEAEARDLNLFPNDELVQQSVYTDPNFADDNQNFSLAKFDQYLANIGLNEQQFFDKLQDSFLQSVILGSLFLASNSNQYLAQNYYNYYNSSLDVSYIRIPIDASTIDYKDSDLLEYYNNNISDYSSSGSKNITFTILDSKTEVQKQVVSDEELNKFYSENIDRYSKPETRILKWLFFDSENNALEFYQDVKDSSSLTGENVIVVEDAQSKFSIADKKLANKIFEYHQTGLTKPLEGQYGWYIVEIVKINPALIPSRESVIIKMKNNLRLKKAYDTINEKLNNIENELSNNNSLSNIKSTLGLDKIEVIRNLTPDTKPKEININLSDAHKAELLSKANSLDINEERFRTIEFVVNSESIKYVIVYLNKINPKDTYPFETVSNKVAIDYKTFIAKQQADKLAQSYLSNFETNHGKYKLNREKNLSRAESSEVLPDIVRNYILASNTKNKAAIYATDDYSYVFKVNRSSKQDSKGSDLSSYQQQASKDFQDGLFTYFTDYLKSQHKVTIEAEKYRELYQ